MILYWLQRAEMDGYSPAPVSETYPVSETLKIV